MAAWGLGRIHERDGRLDEALAAYRDAVHDLEDLAGQFGEEASRAQFLQAANRVRAYDGLARVLLKLQDRRPGQGYDTEAWAVLEAKRSRLVAEALTAARPVAQDTELRVRAQHVDAARGRLTALERAVSQARSADLEETPTGSEQDLTTLLAQTKVEYLNAVRDFLARYPRYKAQFVDQQTVDPRAMAKFAGRLPRGMLAVQYFAAPDALYVFVVAAGGRFQVKRQAVSQADLYALVRRHREHLARAATRRLPWADDGSEAYRTDVLPLKDAGEALASHLLRPIEAELEEHRDLVLIPNDLLLYVAIHALPLARADGSRPFLAETHTVSYLTQLELAELLAPPARADAPSLLALANPDGSLPAAGQEVRALAVIRPRVTALSGSEATKARFLELAARFPDLHLATHGSLDPVRPERSYLLMAGPDEDSRQLSIREIAGLSLPPSGVAVLSACETALGEQEPGAALMTLAAAFSQAGAQTVVASLWNVNDVATRDLMVGFYRALRTQGRAAALREAQVRAPGQSGHRPPVLLGAVHPARRPLMSLAEYGNARPQGAGPPGAPGSAGRPDKERAGRAHPPIPQIPQRGRPEGSRPWPMRSPRPPREAIHDRRHPGVPPPVLQAGRTGDCGQRATASLG